MSSRRRSLSVDRFTPRTVCDTWETVDLTSVADGLRTLHLEEHYSLERALQNPPYHDFPSITSTLQSLNKKYAEAKAMIQEFTEYLDQRTVAIQEDTDTLLLEIARDRDWWDSIDVLTTGYSKAMIHQLFLINEPEDPVAYGRSIKRMISTTAARLKDLDFYGFQWFTSRAYCEIVRISDMPDGDRTALDLFLHLAVDIPPLDSNWAGAEFYMKMHNDIRESIGTILFKTEKLQEPPFYGLANASRRVRTRMLQTPCRWDDRYLNRYGHNTCLYNTLLPLLDLMQRHAYFEIRSIVRQALGTRLPEELFQLVLDRTLAAEGISTDPRILVFITPQDSPGRVKCLLPCGHDLRSPNSLPPSDVLHDFVHDSSYEVVTPNFPNSVASASSLLELEFAAAFPDRWNPYAPIEPLENLTI